MATERPEGQESDGESKEMRPPKDTKEEIPDIGALVRAETHVENPLEVMGTVADGDPRVSVTLNSAGQVGDSAFCVSFDPSTARTLAEMLERRADYAEEYAEYKRKQRDGFEE